jgi:hypothetical protein
MLVIFGAVWSFQQRRWMLPAAAGAAFLIWVYSDHTQSPYVAAKALVVLSPLLLLLAALPLAERLEPDERLRRMPAGWWVIAPILAFVLLGRVADSSARALRISPVGPTSHLVQLRALRSELHGERTLFLGNDDFITWELAGVPVIAPVIGFQIFALPPNKTWSYGGALDIDSVSADTINSVNWVITTRDAAQSALPAQLHLVRTTADFELWRRTGVVAPREILKEGERSGATLDCRTPSGRALIHNGGKAAVRKAPIYTSVPGIIPPGTTRTVRLSLKPGAWDLELQSTVSSRRLKVSWQGRVLRLMPANLDRPGPLWPIGRIVVRRSGPVDISIQAEPGWFSRLVPAEEGAWVGSVVATPVATERIVPLRKACGQFVDWYTTPADSSAG